MCGARTNIVMTLATAYAGFKQFSIPTSDPEVSIVGRVSGSGPPLLLLHCNPLAPLSWGRIAPRAGTDF